MEELKLALEVLESWILLIVALEVLESWILLIVALEVLAYGFYLFLELWQTDRKNLLTLMAVLVGGTVTGIIVAILK